MEIGLIGAGAIGTYLLEQLNRNKDEHIRISSILVRNEDKYRFLEDEYDIKLYTDLKRFLESSIDVVVEAANVAATSDMLPRIVEKKDAVVISIGALAKLDFLEETKKIAAEHGTNIHLPAGAIGGLDLVQNVAAVGIIDKAFLTTKKPADTLTDEKLQKPKIIFEGKAAEAIEKYPKNMNVSIALALAGIGFDETRVTLIADPDAKENSHTIQV